MSTSDTGFDFKTLFEALPGAFLVLDRDYRIVACSDMYLEALGGARRERLVGKALFDFMAERTSEDARASFAELRASFDRVLANGEAETLPPQPYEAPVRRLDGAGMRRGFLSVINTPLRNAGARSAGSFTASMTCLKASTRCSASAVPKPHVAAWRTGTPWRWLPAAWEPGSMTAPTVN